MRKGQKIGVDLAVLLADVALMGGVLRFYMLRQHGQVTLMLAGWFAAAALLCLVNQLLFGKRATMNLVLILDVLCVVAGVVLGQRFLAMETEAVGPRILFALLLAGSLTHACFLPQGQLRQSQLILYLDGLVAEFAILMVLERLGSLDSMGNGLAAAGLAAGGMLLSLISFRLQTPGGQRMEGGKGKGLLFLGGLLAVAALAALWVGRHMGAVSQKIVAAVQWTAGLLWQGVRLVGGGLEAFLLWLASLFPGQEEEWVLPDPQAAVEMEMPAEAEGGGGFFLLVLAGLALAAGGIWLLRRLRGRRLAGWDAGGLPGQPQRVRQIRPKKRRLARLLAAFRFWTGYLGNRMTPAGILTLAERLGRRRGEGRRPWESGPAYLRRITGGAGADCLLAAAAALEQEFYGAGNSAAGREPAPWNRDMALQCRRQLKNMEKNGQGPGAG